MTVCMVISLPIYSMYTVYTYKYMVLAHPTDTVYTHGQGQPYVYPCTTRFGHRRTTLVAKHARTHARTHTCISAHKAHTQVASSQRKRLRQLFSIACDASPYLSFIHAIAPRSYFSFCFFTIIRCLGQRSTEWALLEELPLFPD